MNTLGQAFGLQKRLAKLVDDRYGTTLFHKINQLRWSDPDTPDTGRQMHTQDAGYTTATDSRVDPLSAAFLLSCGRSPDTKLDGLSRVCSGVTTAVC